MQCNIRNFVLFLLVVTSLSLPDTLHSAATAGPAPLPKAPRFVGMWVWQEEYIQNAAEREELLAFCKARGINRLLLQVHFDAKGKIESPDDLTAFLAKAAAAGIGVEALDGGCDMGLADHRDDTLRKLATVLDFQASEPKGQGFAGVHYDIEPYLCARWKAGDIKGVALEYLATMDAILHKVRKSAPGLSVAYDIPAWYDKKEDLSSLDFGGRAENFQRHIQDLSDYVGVMSYRQNATGPNSVVEISNATLAYAAATAKKAYPALETNALKTEPQLTFFGTSPEAVLQTMNEIDQAYKDCPGYGGVLVHDYRGMRRLWDARPGPSTAQAVQ